MLRIGGVASASHMAVFQGRAQRAGRGPVVMMVGMAS